MTIAPELVAPTFDAVVLAGGRGSRLGGVDKAALQLDGERMVDRVIAAARQAGANRVIAVGPPHVGASADCVVREDPPFSGPLAALEASLTEVSAPWLLLLACDLVRPAEVATQLTTALGVLLVAEPRDPVGSEASEPLDNTDGMLFVDETGHRQWLAGCYRTDALRAALRAIDGSQGKSLASAISGLRLRKVRVEARSTSDITIGITSDVDTPEQLLAARKLTRKANQ